MTVIFFLLAQFLPQKIDSSLSLIGLTKKDISFRNDYTARDFYRFAIVDSLMESPLGCVDFLDRIENSFWNQANEKILTELGRIYGITLSSRTGKDFKKIIEGANRLLEQAFLLTPEDLGQVYEELTLFSPIPTASIAEEKAAEKRYDSLVANLKQGARQIDYAKVFQSAIMLLGVSQDWPSWSAALRNDPGTIDGVEGSVRYYKRYDFGEVVIGDTGANIYKRDFAVILDLGGNDIYKIGRQAGRIHILIDKSGDDLYQGENYSIACGKMGISILIDEQGDDTYQAESFSIASGVFGVGILIDKAGNDRYSGDTFTQGAGGFGIGILRDESGNDIYEGALYAQGFASTYGIGLLGDKSGNDMYIIRARYLDEIRYLDHYLSLSQGFTIGFRPELSAGIGIILEREGNDYYLADIFAQGVSYWYGLGAIVDCHGNDNYVAYQYAQGAGTHLTIGVLIDKQGNDNYVAKGVSQGCGHDLSLGLLDDKQGDDSYVAYDLSQGAGNANGIGILIDETGDDNYSVKRRGNTQGYGDFRREYGSIGILLDLKGKDTYTSGKNKSLWQKGSYGIGIDW